MMSEHELRCFCGRSPLLAIYGLDNAGLLYIHVRVFKAKRLYHESYTQGGLVRLRCRECLRWHRVVIRQPEKATLTEDKEPSALSVPT